MEKHLSEKFEAASITIQEVLRPVISELTLRLSEHIIVFLASPKRIDSASA